MSTTVSSSSAAVVVVRPLSSPANSYLTQSLLRYRVLAPARCGAFSSRPCGPHHPYAVEWQRMSFRCRAVKQIGESEFEDEVVQSELPVLVEFVANWCGPCRLIAPIVDWASQEYTGKLKVVKIDHDANPKLIEEHKVYGLPALILFKDGREVPGSRREGAITKAKLKEYLGSLLESTTPVS